MSLFAFDPSYPILFVLNVKISQRDYIIYIIFVYIREEQVYKHERNVNSIIIIIFNKFKIEFISTNNFILTIL